MVQRNAAMNLVIGTAMLACAALAGCVDDTGPRLVSARPPAAKRGEQVVLDGERLCGMDANCDTAAGSIQIGTDSPTYQAVVIEYTDTAARIAIPTITPVGETQIIVTVNERSSNALVFEVLP